MHPGGNADSQTEREGGRESELFMWVCFLLTFVSLFSGRYTHFCRTRDTHTHTEGESSRNCKSVSIRTQREPGITLEAAQLEDGVTWGQHTQCGCFGDLKEAVTAF